jgi:hypothetical protein
MELDAQGRFRPADPISRHEAAEVFARLMRMVDYRTTEAEPPALSDTEQLPPAAKTAVLEAVRAGLLDVHQRRFRPSDSLTRGEAAVAFYRLLQLPW